MEMILSSKPVQRVCPLATILGSNVALLEQTVFPDDILGLLVVTEQLIDHLLVDCHGSFHFLPPIAVYTVLFTPSDGVTCLVSQVCVFSESRMREICMSGSTSGNRKQSQVKPDCGGCSESSAQQPPGD